MNNMASAIKCDKCGTTSTKVSEFMHIRIHTMVSSTRFNNEPLDHLELCQKCYDEIFNFNKESEDK